MFARKQSEEIWELYQQLNPFDRWLVRLKMRWMVLKAWVMRIWKREG